MRSLYYVHEMNAYRVDLVCLSARVIQLDNRWTDLDGIWYGCYAIGVYRKVVVFSFLQSVIQTWRTN
jgi:hypothetical protein